jgi:hypothetical protein
VNAKILEWTNIRCKLTPTMIIGGGQTTEDRESGLAKILTYDITEKERQWLDYYKEETQISKFLLTHTIELDLSDMILDVILDETVDIMTEH